MYTAGLIVSWIAVQFMLWKSYSHGSRQYYVSTAYINKIDNERVGGSPFYNHLVESIHNFTDGIDKAHAVRSFTTRVWIPATVVAMIMCIGLGATQFGFFTTSNSQNYGLMAVCLIFSMCAAFINVGYRKTKTFSSYELWGMKVSACALEYRREELSTILEAITSERDSLTADADTTHATLTQLEWGVKLQICDIDNELQVVKKAVTCNATR